jgi:ABC-2 type transport system permease protein
MGMISTIGRYGKVLRCFWAAAIASELEYRVNFLMATLASLIGIGGGWFGLFLFYRGDYRFQGWQWEEALIVLGVFTLVQGFVDILLVSNLNRIVHHVQQGTLDFVLLKPISAQFWLSTYSFSLWGIPDFIFGLGVIGYAGNHLDLHWSAYLAGLVPLGFSFIIIYSLWFMLGATSIWFVKIYNVTEVLRGLVEAGRFPITAYPLAYRFFFTFIVPVVFLTTIPAEVILGQGTGVKVAIAGILALILLVISNYFWRFALRFYTSASS